MFTNKNTLYILKKRIESLNKNDNYNMTTFLELQIPNEYLKYIDKAFFGFESDLQTYLYLKNIIDPNLVLKESNLINSQDWDELQYTLNLCLKYFKAGKKLPKKIKKKYQIILDA